MIPSEVPSPFPTDLCHKNEAPLKNGLLTSVHRLPRKPFDSLSPLSAFFPALEEKGPLLTPQNLSLLFSSSSLLPWFHTRLPQLSSLSESFAPPFHGILPSLLLHTYRSPLVWKKKKLLIPMALLAIIQSLFLLPPSSFENERFPPINYNLASSPATIESALGNLMQDL